MSRTPEPIAIIGSACRFPGGSDSTSKLWELLKEPRDLSTKVPTSRFDVDTFYHPEATHHGTTNATKSYFLEEDIAQFDAAFFNIQPMESDAIDPQQRLLLETVYDSLGAAGLPLEKLRGSPTAVYVGMMCDDWSTMVSRDWETLPTYAATGLARSIVSNRISYFFDWHGPSMTIDTACSSSLVAVHQAVQTLRSGESTVAVATGTNLILSPAMYVSETNLRMLSPTGRCAMWDVAADGYARGEGVASVVLKTLSQALADGDPIECIIRETGVNQDGRTTGLTMPSNLAQAALVRDTYRRAGLDVNDPSDRPQFFHAHGTGTQAGDPQESEAISTALFPNGSVDGNKLYVGSIKTVIGHTEGAAGLASLVGTSLAMRHGIIPPNLHFSQLSPKVAPFFEHLTIPTVAMPWPELRPGQVKRASVNSFGFGGTNAHAIIESYEPETKSAAKADNIPLYTPLVFSAASEKALQKTLSTYLEHLKASPSLNIHDLAWTLQARRSTLPYRKVVVAPTVEALAEKLDAQVDDSSNKDADLSTRYSNVDGPKILGVFTGQGAQWPRMGARLIESSAFAQKRIAELDGALQSLPAQDRPAWTIKDQLLAARETSRIAEAALSQPLCLAVQVVMVDIFHTAGIKFTAVVGHSSGEMGAAYAAGLLSARDAVRIAYYRGLHAKLASSPNGFKGAMVAVGTSQEDAAHFCQLEMFKGRIQVAAVNSASSITLSGDEDAIDEAVSILKDEQKFARKLKIDTAYHSAHMAPCAEAYLESMKTCAGEKLDGNGPVWFSSVNQGVKMSKDTLTESYWVDNMCNAVLFSGAVAQAISESGPFDLAIEVGPHPALKGPATANIEELGPAVPYTGVLSRDKNDIDELSAALGFIWTRLGSGNVDFDAVDKLLSGVEAHRSVVPDLPTYPFDHQRTYWTGSRVSNHYKHRLEAPNPILGTACSEGTTAREFQWRNILRPNEIHWLTGHRLQGQVVFPATGYVSMAVEAMKSLAAQSEISSFKIIDLEIGRAIAFNDEGASVEVLFNVSSVETTDETISADFACYSTNANDATASLNAKGRAVVQLATAAPSTLPVIPSESFNLVEVDDNHFYANLTKIGYGYSSPFQGVSHIKRNPGYSTGRLEDQSGSEWEDNLVIHPGVLDTALQTAFAAWSFPGDGRLWSLHVPTNISSITFNPYFSPLGIGKQTSAKYESFIRSEGPSTLSADIHLYTADGSNSFVQMEGVSLVPFSPASAANDSPLFSNYQYRVAEPNGELAALGEKMSDYEVQTYQDIDRIAYWYTKNVAQTITPEERQDVLPHFKYYLRWCDHMVDMVSRGEHPKVSADYGADTREDIDRILKKYEGRDDIRFVEVVGDNLVKVIREGSSMLEYMNQDDLMLTFYENGLAAGPNNRWLGRLMAQISHRYPHMHILEIGAGTGATTKSILPVIGSSFSTYTFTDVSSGFFPTAEERFKDYSNRMIFKSFNMENPPSDQGFVEGQYDVVVAANVLHVSGDMEKSMANVRRLLKPGGYLITLEVTSTELLFSGMTVGTLPGWWLAAENGRPWGPSLSLAQWDSVLQKTGFSGIDTMTPDVSTSLPVTVFVARAVDDRTMLLRNPLAFSSPDASMENLAIVGGVTGPVSQLSEDIFAILSHKYTNISAFETIEELAASEESLTPGMSILNLTDLDQPFMKTLTAEKFNALKTLWNNAGTLIWVTRGSREDEPYSYMMVGIGRTIKTEYPNINLQMFDIEGLQDSTARTLSEALIRHQLLSSWSVDTSSLLWSAEPEIFLQDGHALIPRLLPNEQKNKRYNSQRRAIFRNVNPQEEIVRLVGAGKSFELHEASPLRLAPTLATESRTIRITHSLLQNLRVGAAGFLRLSYGVDSSSAEPILALSGSTESPAVIPLQWCIKLADEVHDPSSLVSIAANIVAEQIISIVPQAGTLLVNEPDHALKSALKIKATEKNINTLFTTAQQHAEGGDWIYLHPNFSQHTIKQRLPSSVAVFAHFSKGSVSDAVQELIVKGLPPQCVRIQESSIFSNELDVFSGASNDDTSGYLNRAWLAASTSQTTENKPGLIPIEDVPNHFAVGESLAVVDWTSASVSVKIQPIDSDILFRSDRTYLFVGLAGEIGQSLCAWMIARGARHVVLSSRTPRVNPKFVESMAQLGATVKPISLDITSRKSLRNCYKEISSTMPAIAGVINGAMILQDDLFDNMSHEQFLKVIRPKVEGTKLLDELFYDTPLDFFIVTSSITAVIGFSGQSNYSAANTFMTSLMYQRKKRGVAGSTMDIPAVAGIGYAAQGNNFDFDYFKSIGYINISEQDLCVLFAETVLSGRPGSPEKSEIVTGVNYIQADLHVKETHRRDVKFTHYLLEQEKDSGSGSGNTTVRVKVQLESAKSKDQVYSIIQESFVRNLKKILQIAEEEPVNESVALVEQGLDSLVAVEVRSWFLKEIDVDIPVLKVLGGSSISDLLDTALEKIPASVVDLSALEKGVSAAPKSSSPPRLPQKPSIPKHLVVEAESSSVSTPLSSTPVDTPSETGASSLDSPPYEKSAKKLGPTEEELERSRRELIISSSPVTTAEMSFGQARFWFLNQFLKDKTPFNFSFSARIAGPLRLQAFERALNVVVQRHEALRTRFFWSEGDTGIPMQGVISAPLLKLEKRTISTEAEAAKELESIQTHTYDLEKYGAVRMKLLTLSDKVHYFLMGCHHIALDGQSTHIFITELDKAYKGQALPTLPASSQYRAFAAQQRREYESGALKTGVDFFRRVITKDPGAVELFPFSRVASRKVMEQYKLHRASTRLEPKFAMRIKQLARKLHSTNFHVYLSVLQAMVFRLLPETNEFFVGIADSNRVDKEFIGTLGCLVNLLPIKFGREESSKLSDAVKSTRNKVYAALEHSKVPFDVLLNDLGIIRSGAYNPIFQIFMDYQQGNQENIPLAGGNAEVAFNNASTGYDLQLEVIDTAAGESLVVLKLQSSLYSQRHAEMLLRSYVSILDQFTQNPTGDVLLSSPNIWSKKDIDQAFEVGKGPAMDILWPQTVAHRVDDMVKAYPTNIALKDGAGNILTYAQMADRVNTIATDLVKAGVSDGTVVAVFQEPSADWMCSLLAIFRTGGTYVPLDSKNGTDRLIGSVRVASPEIILADKWTKDTVSSLQAQNARTINVSEIETRTTDPIVPNRAKADATAVILFTSGSTGVPKGIVLPHSCLETHAEGVERAWSVGPNVVLQQITLSFDFSLHQIFTALANGGTLCIVPSDKRGDPAEITKLMLTEGVTHTVATPTEYGLWFQLGAENLSKSSAWKWALVGGEALPKSIIRGFGDLGLSSLKLYDFYGPVEATIAITKGEIRYREIDLDQSVATGHMLPNYSVYILDDSLKPVPVGVPGEIVAGGPGVAAGYLGLDELTNEKFIKSPFQDEHAKAHGWDRLYRTGDRGRLGEDGALYYEGRIDGDTQVKIHGIRTELGEIESAILQAANGAITQAVVSVHGEADSKFLVGYVVFSPQHTTEDRDQFLTDLRSSLPIAQYMRPSFFVPLGSIPMNTHGKTDRKALNSIPLPHSTNQGSVEPVILTDTETRLGELWTSILPSRRIELQEDTDFFRIGGNSLLLVKLQRLLKETFCAAPRLIDLMNSSDLRSMAKVIQSAAADEAIDWKSETAIPESWLSIQSETKRPSNDNLTILLTGATGYLGRHLLARLAGDSRISKIICLVRDETKLTTKSDKISVFISDLGEPNLGLSPRAFDELSESADLIIHCAANRSFWDDYEALRPVNFNSVKELTRLALPHRLPLHFFSSGAIRLYDGTSPPADGGDGYVTAKWASERLLRNVAQQLELPVCIHSPNAAPADTPFTLDPAIIGNFVECAKRVGARPSFEGFWGHLDLIETKDFIDKVSGAVFNETPLAADSDVPSLSRVPYDGITRLDVDHSMATLSTDQGWNALRTMDVLSWMGEVKKNGFPYVLSSQDITMSSASGKVASRR